MTTLSDETLRRQVGLEARGTSGSTLKATSTALGLLLLTLQAGSGLAASPEKRVFGGETVGTGTEIVSLRITQQDLVAQLSRVYRALSSQQVELDAEASRVLYQNLWSLY
jgi:hypothetical protein